MSFETFEHLINSRIRDEILRAVEINTKILFQNISFSILETHIAAFNFLLISCSIHRLEFQDLQHIQKNMAHILLSKIR